MGTGGGCGQPAQGLTRRAREPEKCARRLAGCVAGCLAFGGGLALLRADASQAQSNISVQQPGSCKTDFKIEIQGGASGVSIRQQGSSNMLRSEQRDGKTSIEIGGPQCFYRITVETVAGGR